MALASPLSLTSGEQSQGSNPCPLVRDGNSTSSGFPSSRSPRSRRGNCSSIPAPSFFTLSSALPATPPAASRCVRPVPSDAVVAFSSPKQLLNVSSGEMSSPEVDHPPKKLEAEVPALLSLAKHYWAWLLPPVGLLLLAMPGLYFAQQCTSYAGTAALFAAVQLLTMGYFLTRAVCHVQALLLLLEAKADLLHGCDVEQVSSIVSGDERVRFLQLALYIRRTSSPIRHLGVYADSHTTSDPLHFLSLDISARSSSEDGHVIVNPSGTIMWCNDALATYFGYTPGDLVSENIRLLMPPPYNTIHDGLMRKYSRESTTKRIVGCTRTVPVVDRDGIQSLVGLTVEERIDPTDEANALFVARIAFPRSPSLLDLVQERLWDKSGVAEGCWDLKGHPENFLIADARGEILFASDRLVALLGWQGEGLEGNNLAALMSPDTGSLHADFMFRYVKRATGAPGHASQWPDSRMVGTGRDLYARCRDGHYLRTWITVHRLDAPTCQPEDCCFLGTVVYIQAPEGRRPEAAEHSPSYRSHPSRAPVGHHPWPATHRLSAIVHKRCTVVMIDICGLLDLPEHEVGVSYEAFLQLLTAACHKHNGQLQNPVGDRSVVSFNVTSPNLSQRTAAAALMQHVMEEWRRTDNVLATPVYCAAVHAPALCATYGRNTVFLGESLDLCACLVRIAAESQAQNGIIDMALYDELQYAYECRLVNQVILYPKQPNARCMAVYELFSLKDVDEDEWMYQIKPHNKADPLVHWRSCWDHLEGCASTPLPGRVIAVHPVQDALDCLECHIDEHPCDPTATWLQHILLQRMRGTEPAGVVDVAGKIPYCLQYHTAASPQHLQEVKGRLSHQAALHRTQ